MSTERDHYRTLAAPVEYRQKIERSEFLAVAFAIAEETQFFGELETIEKRHFDATHHCWAFRLFADGEPRVRSSDAGEPSGTAGKPILSAIEGAELYDVGVVVVRWYGGVKLGTGGLGRAYRDTAAGALRLVQPLDRYLYERIRVIVPFPLLSTVYRLIAPPDVLLIGETYGEENEFTLDVRKSKADDFARTLVEKRLR
jgi:uncharacterized YigZ family protein